MVLWSTLTYGIALLPLSSIPLSTLTIGNLKLQVSTLQDQPIKTFLLAPSPSNLGSDFGKLGHLANARLLFGWHFEIAAGQQTGCRKGASLIRCAALFVTKMTRIFNTFLHLCICTSILVWCPAVLESNPPDTQQQQCLLC